MNIHIYIGEYDHLVKPIVRTMNKVEKNNSIHIIFGKIKREKIDSYRQYYSAEKCNNVLFIKKYSGLIKFILKNKNDRYIFHGINYLLMFILIIISKKRYWICWGAGTKTNKRNIKSVIAYPLKKFIYKKMNIIITLTDDDKINIEKNFEVKNVKFNPYPNFSVIKYKSLLDELYLNKTSKKTKKILVGNSTHCIQGYEEIMKNLALYENIEVSFMMQYPKLNNTQIEEFEKKCNKTLKNRYKLDFTLMELDEYYKYLSKHDIYICPQINQSGLGAAISSLNIGLKVIVRGINLNYLIKQGFKVFDLDDEIKNNTIPKTIDKQNADYNRSISLESNKSCFNKWYKFINNAD